MSCGLQEGRCAVLHARCLFQLCAGASYNATHVSEKKASPCASCFQQRRFLDCTETERHVKQPTDISTWLFWSCCNLDFFVAYPLNTFLAPQEPFPHITIFLGTNPLHFITPSFHPDNPISQPDPIHRFTDHQPSQSRPQSTSRVHPNWRTKSTASTSSTQFCKQFLCSC